MLGRHQQGSPWDKKKYQEKDIMATATFSSLPAEIQVSIAEYCEIKDLINFCCTSRQVYERCLPVVYHCVDLKYIGNDENSLSGTHRHDYSKILDDQRKRQGQFLYALLSHPGYGKHVRSFKGQLYIPSVDDCRGNDDVSGTGFWRAIQSLTNVHTVDIASRHDLANRKTVPPSMFPTALFQSATSVRLAGPMQYRLAKSILDAIQPAMLRHLCLDLVQDHKIPSNPSHVPDDEYQAGDVGEDGRIIALGATTGLLTTLTGRCTALRTLTLRRIRRRVNIDGSDTPGRHATAEDASYMEWATFIRSVQATVERFTFEQVSTLHGWTRHIFPLGFLAKMDERFRQYILPAIVSGNWPCLTTMEISGVHSWHGPGDMLAVQPAQALQAVLGENAMIVVTGESGREAVEPRRWNSVSGIWS